MNFETTKCQVIFFYECLTFFLGLFGPTSKCWVFIGIFVQVYWQWKSCFLLAFLSKSINGESFVFYWHFCPSLPTVKVLVFIDIFVQVYQLWKLWCLLAFLSKFTNGKSFVFYWPFLSKSTNCESFGFCWHFCPSLPTVKSFGHFGHDYFYWSLWLGIPVVTVMWFGVCLWANFGIPLRHTRVHVHRRQPRALHCANRSSCSRTQLLAWD